MSPVFLENQLDFFGGGERYAYRVARALLAQCDVTFVTFGPRQTETMVDGVRCVSVRASGADPENPVPSLGFFLRERFDVVHVYQFRSTVTSMLAILARLQRRPLVVSDVGGGGRSLMFRLRLYQLIRRFILISEFSRAILPPSVRARSAVVKGGIDLDQFGFDPRARKQQVLQVGRIMPHKGFNYLIEAAGSDIPVVIAGRVKDQDYFNHLKRLSEGKQVTFVLDPDDHAVVELYRSSAVTVAASVYRDAWGKTWPMSELLGLTLLESMAVGTPVVCTDVGGMPEYVVDGSTGFVVPPNEPSLMRTRVEELLRDPGLATTMGRAGHAHVQQYSWESVATRIAQEYGLVLRREKSDRVRTTTTP